jgi:tetratricopeptide (TPR) repeat protein
MAALLLRMWKCVREASDFYNLAIKELVKGLEIDPEFCITHYQLGAVYYEMGDLEKALEAFRNTIRYMPQKILEAYEDEDRPGFDDFRERLFLLYLDWAHEKIQQIEELNGG